ncbi:rRNA maturation RNase YbeY [Phosphitispora fastidiosa]|uniref:rRNA maturation RNase YbeY n=1 Tax=Phosphitispora fastidiosa TaxID=2837202 RepID=UPI001E5E9854|nr:rRNA maturation RNase YbeY [Phosphitispora fastidiosa]MBU7005886.1 putative rRNA maturation factor [Phosphitispora fastidiosa]
MPVFVNNLQEKVPVTNKLLDAMEMVAATSLKVEGREDDPEVTIAFVDDAYIKELNYKFRHKGDATDVLSFPMEEAGEGEPVINGEDEINGESENILGDIVISMEMAQRQAEEYGHDLMREMAFLATHGMFHLLGYDHDNEDRRRIMREREEKVLSLVNITR